MGFPRRRLLTAALTANAVRPPMRGWPGVAAFPAGWLTGELAPQLLTLTAADTALAVARRKASPWSLALAGGTAAGLGLLIRESLRVGETLDAALDPLLGPPAPGDSATDPEPPPDRPAWVRLLNPFHQVDPRVRVDRDLRFSDAGGRGLLDVYRPAWRDLDRAPVLVQVHGGGWVVGRKDQQGVPLMQLMAAHGWVCVAINYRLAPRDRFPAQIIDVKRALAWVREHIADYGGDPGYVAITGGSAGGHLSALAALTAGDPAFQPGFEDADTSVAAAVPHYGVYDIAGATGLRSAERMRDEFFAPRVMGRTWAEAPEEFEAGSPILRLHEDAPDFFVVHGARDSLVDVEQARLFVERLRATSRASVAYAELPGTQHAFDIFPSIRSIRVAAAVQRYLEWHHRRWLAARTAPVGA
ncbi:alpha/beta hydrolase fold domain-containing protein [Nocardioides sp.]|uniref:alpha/beta hydrolase fold domain-containing protein n=1 Tax=Nocardioides sp. TaxID=35761 RepID=UPI003529A6C5